ncbi:hypothetical protein [Paraburkholderia sp. J76]|uniref:hypothetical protein n=1 Tax=Paraburkholderia sp. J76 TaxID=2805439 RepID=UPI002ABDEFDB|nr:hypothetical protein [Paraburkholderia sp. J76]
MLALLSDSNDITEAFLSDTKRIADNARYYYEDYAQAYSSACSRLQGIRAQTSSQREKHYALGCKTIEDVRQYSDGKRDVGIMFPTLTPQLQEYAFWLSMAHLFDSTEREHERDAEDYSREAEQSRFELAWKQLLGEPQSYRICLDALGPVGFYNGALANFLIFDVSLQSQIFHCYPALEPIPGLSVACVDDLQGLDDCLVEKRPFPFP